MLKRLTAFLLSLTAVATFAACGASEEQAPEKIEKNPETRVVTLGGDITEIVYALGAGPMVVASDKSSSYPDEVLNLPRLNYHRQVSPEGILSQEPDLVLLTAEAGPPGAIEQLESATNVKTIPTESTIEAVPDKIRAIAEALDMTEAGEELVKTFEKEMEAIREEVASYDSTPSVIFLYARQGMGAPMVGGTDSGADIMIELAGGKNAAAELDGFQPLTPEALLEFNPDCILMLDKGYEAIGKDKGLLAVPGMAETEAGMTMNVVTMPDNLLLSYGPRTPEAVRRLADAIHPERKAAGK